MKLAQFGSRDFLKAIRPFVGLFVVLLLFAMDAELRSLFFKGGNFKTILTQTVIVAIGAMGMTLVIVSGEWLLSIKLLTDSSGTSGFTVWLSASHLEMPRAIPIIPSVTMNGIMRNAAMMPPFARPASPPTSTVNTSTAAKP